MRYICLIYRDPTIERDPSIVQAYYDYSEEVQSKGVMLAGDALQGVETATTVRVRNGDVITSDGPFAETKEVLGGFYLLDCKDLDEAIYYAAKIPGALHGSIEVRPIQEFPPREEARG